MRFMARLLPYERGHLRGVVALCVAERWPSFPADPERAHRAMTAPGVTTVVAESGGTVVGFACLQSDGEIQAHLSIIVVDAAHRRRGIARALVAEALDCAGGERVDLVTDSAEGFYGALMHRRLSGFRIYPPFAPAVTDNPGPVVREAVETDTEWITGVLLQRWGATTVVSRGKAHDAAKLPAVVAELAGERLGLATYHAEGEETELVTLDALVQDQGVGTSLLRAVGERAASLGCFRIWLVATNDNLDSIRFCQRRGMRIAAVHRGAVDDARRSKPSIPRLGAYAIPVHDEIELELTLDERRERSSSGPAPRREGP